VFASISCLVLLLLYAAKSPKVRMLLGDLLWKIPIVGERMRIYQLARFYRTLGMLCAAGIPLMTSLGQVGDLLDLRLQARLKSATSMVREGQPLSKSLDINGLSTPIASRLLAVGERSGQIGDMMEHIADFHEEELSRWIDWASRLFEPLLMTFIGLVIGIIVVLMYMPIFEIAGSIQ
jgi:general secretion pathway protein F